MPFTRYRRLSTRSNSSSMEATPTESDEDNGATTMSSSGGYDSDSDLDSLKTSVLGLGDCDCRMEFVILKLLFQDGICDLEATLVVVRPIGGEQRRCETEETYGDDDDAVLAAEAFGSGIYAEAAEKLLKGMSYILEMNSF